MSILPLPPPSPTERNSSPEHSSPKTIRMGGVFRTFWYESLLSADQVIIFENDSRDMWAQPIGTLIVVVIAGIFSHDQLLLSLWNNQDKQPVLVFFLAILAIPTFLFLLAPFFGNEALILDFPLRTFRIRKGLWPIACVETGSFGEISHLRLESKKSMHYPSRSDRGQPRCQVQVDLFWNDARSNEFTLTYEIADYNALAAEEAEEKLESFAACLADKLHVPLQHGSRWEDIFQSEFGSPR